MTTRTRRKPVGTVDVRRCRPRRPRPAHRCAPSRRWPTADTVVLDRVAREQLLVHAPARRRGRSTAPPAPTARRSRRPTALAARRRRGQGRPTRSSACMDGDPATFDGLAEEATACAKAHVPFEVVPGVPSVSRRARLRRRAADRRQDRGRPRRRRRPRPRVDWSTARRGRPPRSCVLGGQSAALDGRRGAARAPGAAPRRRSRSPRRAPPPTSAPSSATLESLARAPQGRDPGRAGGRRRRRRRRPARAAVVVRDQAAVRLAGAGAAHQGAGRRAVGAAARHGAVPEEVPTISVEPPRTPQQMDRAIQGLVAGRYLWVAFTSVNAVRAVREKFEEYGLDARAFAGIKVAAVGEQTAAALTAFGIQPDLVPSGEQSSAGLLEDWPDVRRGARPDRPGPPAPRRHRHRDAGRRPGRARLGGRRRHRLPHGARAPPPAADSARRSRAAASTRWSSPRRRRCATWSASRASRTRPRSSRASGRDGEDRGGARPAGRRPRAERRRSRRWPRRWPSTVRPRGLAALERASRPGARRSGAAPPGARRSRPAGADRASPSSVRAGCGATRRAASAGRRDPAGAGRPGAADVRQGGDRRAGAGHVDARRRPAHPGLAAQGRRRGGRGRRRRADPVRRSPSAKDAAGSQADADEGIVQVGPARPGRRGRRRHRGHGRPVPVRVHRPRALRSARRRRRGRQRRDAGAVRGDGAWPRPPPAPTWSRRPG